MGKSVNTNMLRRRSTARAARPTSKLEGSAIRDLIAADVRAHLDLEATLEVVDTESPGELATGSGIMGQLARPPAPLAATELDPAPTVPRTRSRHDSRSSMDPRMRMPNPRFAIAISIAVWVAVIVAAWLTMAVR